MTLAGQDISPLPPIKNIERRNRAERDFKFFCETYFPHVFFLEWSQDHLRVIGKIERVVRYDESFAVAMPRGGGKTSLCLIAVIWAILPGRHEFVYLIPCDGDMAITRLENIKTHLRSNELLAEDFPEAIHPIRCLNNEARRCKGQRFYGTPTDIVWGLEELIFPTIPGSKCSGSIIRVAGILGGIRGALHVRTDGTQVRPTLALCDDPQTDESARSILQTSKRMAVVKGAVKGLAGPQRSTAVLVPCTVIQEDDLADQLLDRKKNPSFHGERMKMVYAFPENLKLWDKYFAILDEAMRTDSDIWEATRYYEEHIAEMDLGAVVAWPQRYVRKNGEISGIQCAMNLMHEDRRAFFAERQNTPLPATEMRGHRVMPADVCERVNGRRRGEIPLACSHLTMFVDVHDKLLYYAICAWQDDFTGYVVDYGTWPHQSRAIFTLETATRTLGRLYQRAGKEGAIQRGLEELIGDYLNRDWKRGAGVMRIERLLVDMGYKPNLVGAARRKVGGTAMIASLGKSIKAGNKPMSEYRRKPGESLGHHWHMPNVKKTAEFPHISMDINHWKSKIHTDLDTTPGDPGSLTIFGAAKRGQREGPAQHELFAQQLVASEFYTETQGRGRKVQEWSELPSRPDNHWLDCMVGCYAAAAHIGIKPPGDEAESPKRERKRYTSADLKRRS